MNNKIEQLQKNKHKKDCLMINKLKFQSSMPTINNKPTPII